MKILSKFKLLIFIITYTPACFASSAETQNMTQLFKKLGEAGVDQVVELPFNKSLLANIGKQVRFHNIGEMQGEDVVKPEPRSLYEEYIDSIEMYSQRDVVPELSYKVGKEKCAYMEALKVNSSLVCYRKASPNQFRIGQRGGARCTTATADLSHCYMFTHAIDSVLEALSELKTEDGSYETSPR